MSRATDMRSISIARQALLALSRGALGDPSLGSQLAVDLGAPDSGGALVRSAAALLDQPRGAALGLLCRGQRALDVPAPAVGGLTCRVRCCDRLAGGLDRGERTALGARGDLRLGNQLIAPVALGEDTLAAALRRLAQLPRRADPRAAGGRDGDTCEGVRDRGQVIDGPDAREQAPRQRGAGCGTVDEVGERPGARRRRLGQRCDGWGVARDQGTATVRPEALEQRAPGRTVGDDRRAQASAERSGDGQLVAGLDLEVVRERTLAARGGRVRAQELIGGGELRADTRGFAARLLGGALARTQCTARKLGGTVRLGECGDGAVNLPAQRLGLGGGLLTLGFEAGELTLELSGAFAVEVQQLGLERLDPGVPGGVRRVGLGLRLEHLEPA